MGNIFDDLFGNFTGSKSRKDLATGYAQSNEYLDSALANAKQALAQGRIDLDTYYQIAQQAVDGAAAQGREDITTGANAGRNALTQGRDAAKGAATDYLGRSIGYLQPFIDSGNTARQTYDDVLGLNGAPAAAAGVAKYQSNPYLEQQTDKVAQQVDRERRAHGEAASGPGVLAAARAPGELRYGDYKDWETRIGRQAELGGQYAGKAADMTSHTGDVITGLESGYGKDLAGLETDTGGKLADFTGKMGLARSSNALTRGSAGADLYGKEADLDWGYGTTKAGNTINYANAKAGTRDTGLNNLFKIGGLAVQGYAASKYPAYPGYPRP